SATPAASASLSRLSSFPAALPSSARESSPIQAGSRLAAVQVVPPITTPGNVTPIGPDQPKSATSCLTASATGSGCAGLGVGTLTPSAARVPVVTSTGAALIPEPPISIPSTSI